MIGGFYAPIGFRISTRNVIDVSNALKDNGYGNYKLKLKRKGNDLVLYCTRGIHSLRFDCFNNYNFTNFLYSRRILGNGRHVMPATLTVNETLRYLDASRLSMRVYSR